MTTRRLPLPEHQPGLPQLDAVAVAQEPHVVDDVAVDPGPTARGVAAEQVPLGRYLDLGVPPGDAPVAEQPDLGALIQSHGRDLAGQQVDPPFLPSGED